jgi:tetratricopeptide (TPR) repeat protein
MSSREKTSFVVAGLFFGSLSVLAACGGAAKPGVAGATDTGRAMEALRARAEDQPESADVQRELAFAELFSPEGDPRRAEAVLARALKLEPKDADALFAAGYDRSIHGDPNGAIGFLVRSLAAGRAQSRGDVLRNEVAMFLLGRDLEPMPNATAAALDALAELEPSADALGFPAAHALRTMLMDAGLRRGQPAEAARLADNAGCQREWRVVGAFGPRVLLGFDEAFAPEKDNLALDRYDLGQGRGAGKVHERHSATCTVHLGEPSGSEGGSFYAASELTVPEDGLYDLRIESPNAIKVFVDGDRLFTLDARTKPLVRTNYLRAPLKAGKHRLLVKLTTRHPNPVLMVAVKPASAGGAATAHGGAAGGDPYDPVPDQGLSGLRRSVVLLARGAAVWSRYLLPFSDPKKASAAALLVAADVAFLDPSIGDDARRDRMRELLRRAEAVDAGLWYPAFLLSRLEAMDGRAVQAIEILEKSRTRWPGRVELMLQLAGLYLVRGLENQADAILEQTHAIAPAACPTLAALRERAQRRKNYALADRYTEQVLGCDATSRARLDVLYRKRRWAEAKAEALRLLALDPERSRASSIEAELRAARGLGDDGAIEQTLKAYLEVMGDDPRAIVANVDWTLARSEARSAAAQQLATLSAGLHEQSSALHRVDDALFQRHPLRRYRLDGAKVIRDFQKSGRTYNQPKIMVLDYTVMAIEPDGSAIELTHNIWRALSDEGVNALGEYAVPEGAELYALRTHKADGRVLEPDLIVGKNTLSLPDLAVGDFVEAEYVRYTDPNTIFPGGFLTWRFYFQSMEEAFDRSELTILAPKGHDLVIDAKGAAPRLERKTVGGYDVLHWVARQSMPVVAEPGSVSAREFIASVQVSSKATWATQMEAMADAFVDLDAFDPDHAELARAIVGEAGLSKAPFAKARAVYDWVLDNVQHENDFYGSAPVMLSSRSGQRTRVFHYLARLLGLDSELVLARSIASDPASQGVPDLGDGVSVFARVKEGAETRFVALDNRAVPFGYVLPMVRGQEAFVLAAQKPSAAAKTPAALIVDQGIGADRMTVKVDVDLHADGSAQFVVEERHEGASAIQWRNGLEEVPPAVLNDRFAEGYVARLVPGAELTGLEMTGVDARDTPLTFRYAFSVREIGRGEGRTRLLGDLFSRNLVAGYASVGTRKYDELIFAGQNVSVRVAIRPVGGAPVLPGSAASSGIEPVLLTSVGGSRFDMRVTTEEKTLVITTDTFVPVMRIPAAEYPGFAAFCRASGQAEAREFTFQF